LPGQRLDSQRKMLIIQTDDVGMCHSANAASLEALRHGAATSGTVMIPCPWVLEVADACRETPGLDLGIHSCFTSEWRSYKWGPVAPRNEVSSLLDDFGRFPPTVADVAQRATADHFERELRAQIDLALRLGIHPTHLDTHMGACFARPDLLQIYLATAREYRIPPLVIRPTEENLVMLPRLLCSAANRPFLESLEDQGFIFIDHFCRPPGGADTIEARRESYFDQIRRCRPGVSLLVTHMAAESRELFAVMSERQARNRVFDHTIFMEGEAPKVAEEAGVQLIGWRTVLEAFAP